METQRITDPNSKILEKFALSTPLGEVSKNYAQKFQDRPPKPAANWRP